MHDYEDILNDKTFRLTAERLVIQSGIRADLQGCSRIIDAVILYGTGVTQSYCEIYRIIGEQYGVQPKSVMREITYTIRQSPKIVENIEKLIGVEIGDVAHNSLVIAYLGRIFQNPSISVFA